MNESIDFSQLFKGLGTKLPKQNQFIFSPLFSIELIQKDINTTNIQALIFTSSNGVKGFFPNKTPYGIKVFCVGKKTKKTAMDHGFLNIFVPTIENANNLSLLINKECQTSSGSLIYPRGEYVSSNISEKLRFSGFSVIEHLVYRQPHNRLKPNVKKNLEDGKIAGVVLFSARTANLFIDCVKELPTGFIFYCISSEVSKVVISHFGLKKFTYRVSVKANSESVKNMIVNDYNEST